MHQTKYVFKFVKFMRKKGRDIEGEGCMKYKDGRLVVGEKNWENYGRSTWKRS